MVYTNVTNNIIINLNNLDHLDSLDNNIQKNIEHILTTKGDTFIIKNNDIELPATIYKIYNSSYYGMKYPVDERTIQLLPYDIVFADYITGEINNSCHINSIHKYGNLSGTQIIETLIKFLKTINVKRITLTDASRINYTKLDKKNIEFDLSLFKMIEKGCTFYHRFGFKPTYRNVYHKAFFEKYNSINHDTINKDSINKDSINNDSINSGLQHYLEKTYALKCNDLLDKYNKLINIFDKVNSNNDYDNIKLYRLDTFIKSINKSIYVYDKSENKNKCEEVNSIFKKLVPLLDLDKEMYFRDLLLTSFNNNLMNKDNIYSTLEKYILKYNDVVGVEYNGEKIMLDFLDNFVALNMVKNMLFILSLA